MTHEIQTWAEGDRLEIYSTMDDGHAPCFTIGNFTKAWTLSWCSLSCWSPTEPQTRLEYRLRHFAAGDGISFDEAEERYVNATGDTMTEFNKQKSTNGSTVLNFNDEPGSELLCAEALRRLLKMANRAIQHGSTLPRASSSRSHRCRLISELWFKI